MDFNPDTFMNATLTEANSTRMVPVPVNDYHAQILELKPKSGTISKGDKAGDTWASLEVTWKIEDANVEQLLGREPKVRQNIFLDLTESGMLDMGEGKNLGLGRLREATGLNEKGKPFSFSMLIGQRAIVKVGHRPDPKDASVVYDEVTGAAKL